MKKTIFHAMLALSLALLLANCGGDDGDNKVSRPPSSGSSAATDPDNDDSYNDVYPAVNDTPYAAVLKRCALAETITELCDLNRLPLLGMDKPNPTVDDIMQRVLTSNPWMATRFKQIISDAPSEFRTLFKGLTAVVLDDDVRPAYYSSGTGAIYIDPAYLWVTNEEKKTINVKQDYRSGFDDELQFVSTYRYVTENGARAANWGSLTDDSNRTYADARFYLSRLLLHELAHVNDFIPYDSYDSINRNHTVLLAVSNMEEGTISDQLVSWRPLHSTIWDGLGKVMFQGETATGAQKALTAEDVGLEFESDSAADDYAYSSRYEDLAMLFEIAMMKKFFNLNYEQAFLTPTGTETYCNEYFIGWGAVGWIGETDVKERAQFVTSALLPQLEMDMFYQDLPGPQYLTQGQDWCAPPSGSGQQKIHAPEIVPPSDFYLPH